MSFKIITGESCRYCTLAKQALDLRDIPYVEVPMTTELYAEFAEKGLTTVPQIWHGTKHVGGYTQLVSYLIGIEGC